MAKIEQLGTPVQPHERFVPLATGSTALQEYRSTGRVFKPDPSSYKKSDLLSRMGPQLVAIIEKDGRVHRVREEDMPDGRVRQFFSSDGGQQDLATFDPTSPHVDESYQATDALQLQLEEKCCRSVHGGHKGHQLI